MNNLADDDFASYLEFIKSLGYTSHHALKLIMNIKTYKIDIYNQLINDILSSIKDLLFYIVNCIRQPEVKKLELDQLNFDKAFTLVWTNLANEIKNNKLNYNLYHLVSNFTNEGKDYYHYQDDIILKQMGDIIDADGSYTNCFLTLAYNDGTMVAEIVEIILAKIANVSTIIVNIQLEQILIFSNFNAIRLTSYYDIAKLIINHKLYHLLPRFIGRLAKNVNSCHTDIIYHIYKVDVSVETNIEVIANLIVAKATEVALVLPWLELSDLAIAVDIKCAFCARCVVRADIDLATKVKAVGVLASNGCLTNIINKVDSDLANYAKLINIAMTNSNNTDIIHQRCVALNQLAALANENEAFCGYRTILATPVNIFYPMADEGVKMIRYGRQLQIRDNLIFGTNATYGHDCSMRQFFVADVKSGNYIFYHPITVKAYSKQIKYQVSNNYIYLLINNKLYILTKIFVTKVIIDINYKIDQLLINNDQVLMVSNDRNVLTIDNDQIKILFTLAPFNYKVWVMANHICAIEKNDFGFYNLSTLVKTTQPYHLESVLWHMIIFINKNILYYCDNKQLIAYDVEKQKQLWQIPMLGNVVKIDKYQNGLAVLCKDKIVICKDDNVVSSFNLIGKYNVSSYDMLIDNDKFYVDNGSDGGQVYNSDGKLISNFNLDGSHTFGLIAVIDNCVYARNKKY